MTYSYLIQHPKALNKAFLACEQKEHPFCQAARQASQDYGALNAEREANPELFGQRILNAQQELGRVQQAILDLKLQLSHTPSDLEMQKKLAQLEKDYSTRQEQVNILLAVVASTSPE